MLFNGWKNVNSFVAPNVLDNRPVDGRSRFCVGVLKPAKAGIILGSSDVMTCYLPVNGRKKISCRMDTRLYQAAVAGNVSCLMESLKQDAAILDRIVASYVTETPLHVAALRGNLHFARELLLRKPELARELNSQGLSSLHLASAKGDVEMVKLLLSFVSDVSLDRDREGRTPLHAAAIKGRVDVLQEVIRVKPGSIRDLTGRGETALHLCVKHGHLEALKVLVGSVDNDELVNRKDEHGNTILHLSASMRQIPVIKYLLGEVEVGVNERNSYGPTALDLLTLCQTESGEIEMEGEILRKKGARRSWEMSPTRGIHQDPDPSPPPPQRNSQRLHDKDENTSDELRAAVMVVAILIATVTFQAGLSPPGGLWQDDSSANSGNATSNTAANHTAGISILDDKRPGSSAVFFFFNTLAFTTSMAVIGSSMGRGPFPWTLVLKTSFYLSLISVQVTYYAGSYSLHNNNSSFIGEMLGWIIAAIAPIVVAGARKLFQWLKKTVGEGPSPTESTPRGVEMVAAHNS